MGIAGLPPNANTHAADSKLKLLAATSLPPASVPAELSSHEIPAKKALQTNTAELSDEAQLQISKLKARDTQVRQHEQAHLSASSGIDVSSASFTYQRGPNGVNYAVGGEVKIDTSPGHTPEETLARAEKIIETALAPVDPSPVDRSVAAKAQNMAQQARIEIQQQNNNQIAKPADHQATVNQAYDSSSPAKTKIDTYV